MTTLSSTSAATPAGAPQAPTVTRVLGAMLVVLGAIFADDFVIGGVLFQAFRRSRFGADDGHRGRELAPWPEHVLGPSHRAIRVTLLAREASGLNASYGGHLAH
jgi:hypothetical protein